MNKDWWHSYKDETRKDKLKYMSDDERIFKSVEKHESGMTIIRSHLVEKELDEFDRQILDREDLAIKGGFTDTTTTTTKTEKVRTEISKELKSMKEPGKATLGLFSKYDIVTKRAKKLIEKKKKKNETT